MSAKNAMAGATLAEVAQALGVSKQAIAKRAEKESWPFAKVSVRGGQQRIYAIADLPRTIRTKVCAWRSIRAVKALGQEVPRSFVMVVDGEVFEITRNGP